MATTSILLTLTLTTLFSSTLSAPAPIDLTDILIRGDQFTFFLRLLNQTRILDQLQDQLNNSNQGTTLFAPTDNAFHNLPAGTINSLSEGKKMELVLYHILPKFYTMEDLITVSNPVPTQAAGDHGVLGLNFTGTANRVHVSTGAVEAKISNALRKDVPFAVYVIDQVLLIPLKGSSGSSSSPPAGAKPPSSPTWKHGAKAPSSKSQTGKPEAMAPNSPAEELGPMAPSSRTGKAEAMPPSSPGGKPEAMAPSSAPSLPAVSPSKNGGGKMGIGMGCGGFVLFCMAFL